MWHCVYNKQPLTHLPTNVSTHMQKCTQTLCCHCLIWPAWRQLISLLEKCIKQAAANQTTTITPELCDTEIEHVRMMDKLITLPANSQYQQESVAVSSDCRQSNSTGSGWVSWERQSSGVKGHKSLCSKRPKHLRGLLEKQFESTALWHSRNKNWIR